MKANKFMLAGMLVAALAMVGCEPKNPADDNNGGNGQDSTAVDSTVVDPTEDYPIVDAPSASEVTIVLYTTEEISHGLTMKACFGDNAQTNFEAVEAYDNWYKVTVALQEDGSFDGKACLLNAEGSVGENWLYQWKNFYVMDQSATIAEAMADMGPDKLHISATGVVYVVVEEWQQNPGTKLNEAGVASFTLTANSLPEGFEVGIVGMVNDLNWDITKPVVMTKGENNVWTATNVPVAAACQYKYFVRKIEGGEWSWDFGEDGGNRFMPFSMEAVDVVDTWKLPEE